MNSQRIASERLPLLPRRISLPISAMSLRVSDTFWRCGVEVAKVIYSRIDARYPSETRDPDIGSLRLQKIQVARKILNEHRNDVLEAVLPLFTVRPRREKEPPGEADQHAYDYIVTNQFGGMVKTYIAWADQFVEPADVAALTATLHKVGEVQRKRLTGLLLNFRFAFVDLSIGEM